MRRFVVGAREEEVPFPRRRPRRTGVLVPVGFFAREAHGDHVRLPVAVEVGDELHEGFGVAERVVRPARVGGERVAHAEVGPGIPMRARDQVGPAVAVQVADGAALAEEIGRDCPPFETRLRGGREGEGAEARQGEQGGAGHGPTLARLGPAGKNKAGEAGASPA